MTINRKIATGIAAVIGTSLLIATPAPSNASPPTRFEVCPAILNEPICDLLRPPSDASDDGGGGTEPAVRLVNRTAAVDVACGGATRANVHVCVA